MPWWKRWWVMALAALAVVGAVAGVVVMTQGDDDEDKARRTIDTLDDVLETVDDVTIPESTISELSTPEITVPEVSGPAVSLPDAPETTVAPTVAPAEATAVGSTAGLTGFDTTVDVTVLSIVDPAPTEEFLGPEEGNRLVAVQLRVVNTGTADYVDSPSNGAVLFDAADVQYANSFLPTLLGPELFSLRVIPGDVRTGWVTFEIPSDVEPAALMWTPDSGFSDTHARWDLLAAPVTPAKAPGVIVGSTPVGTPIELTGTDSSVTFTVNRLFDPATPAEFFEPEPGWRLVAVELTVLNTGSTPYDESPDVAATIIDALGQQEFSLFSQTLDGPPFEGALSLAPGESATGVITFAVPATSVVVKLQMALEFGFGDQLAELALS